MISYLFRFKNRKLLKLSKDDLIKDINCYISARINFNLETETFDKMFESILINYLQKRSCDLGANYYGAYKQDDKMYLKILGSCNILNNNSKWIKIKESDKLNDSLNIHTDLFLSKSDLYFVIHEHMNILGVDVKKMNNSLVVLTEKLDINTIKDLKCTIKFLISDRNNMKI
jgi:hypothetical protein